VGRSGAAWHDYDADARRLRIVYVSGTIFDYFGVPHKVYEAMKKAESKGSFLNSRIKGKYAFERVE